MDVLIPVPRDAEWNKERALGTLPPGTRYTVAEYDDGEYVQAVNEGVKQSPSQRVLLSAPDAWTEREPSTVANFDEGMWNADIAYGPLLHHIDGLTVVQGQEHFCPNRLYRENYLPGIACVDREAFLSVGGITSGMWDLYVRMNDSGKRIKYVPEAHAARDATPEDPSPVPEPKDLKATFYYQATPGTAYWRCLLPARYLPGQAIFNHPVRIENDEGQLAFPQHQGTAVMQFAGDEAHYLLMKALQAAGVRVLIEVDDNYAHWFKAEMTQAGWVETIAESLVDTDRGPVPGKYSVECHVLTATEADGVIVTTPLLAHQYRKFNKNVYVCGNQIDPADWPELDKPDDGIFRIGWFASGSHRADGDLIERALVWAAKQPDVEIVMVGIGATSTGPAWRSFPYRHIPWSNDLSVYKKMIQQFDVNLAPVIGRPWAQFRSDLKTLEGAMAGAITLASDAAPYAHCDVPHLQRCKTPKDFLRAVQWCVANRDLVREQGLEAREYVLEHRTVEANIEDWALAVAA